MSRKVGLLLTKSVLYPSMSFDMAGGLRNGLVDTGIADAEIKTESIGLAADDKLIYNACEKLLFEGAGIVVGYVNPTTAEKLQPLFEAANAVFLALDSGYHFPTSTHKLPNIFYISLQGALCARAVISVAAHAGHKGFVYTGSFYDAGYRTPYACHRGVEDAGGHITFNFITPLKRTDFTLSPLAAHLGTASSDTVFASFCGDMLQDFFTNAAAGHVLDGHAVYGSSFMGEEQWLAKSPYPGADVRVCVPWAAMLENDANTRFKTTLKEKRTNVNIFSLLGWEAGQAAAAALQRGDYTVLEGYSFASPRGTITLDAATHQCHAPVYDATVCKDDATGNCRLVISGVNTYADVQRAALEHDINNISGSVTSWYNAYGCLDS